MGTERAVVWPWLTESDQTDVYDRRGLKPGLVRPDVMPFVIIDGQPVLRCINHPVIQHEEPGSMIDNTTMEAEDEYNSLVGVEPPMLPAPGVPFDLTKRPRLNLQRGMGVLCYVCRVCGYVEMYDAAIIEPGKWRRL
jgi:hypothetical protein